MAFCMNCGAPCKDDSRFCMSCGKPLTVMGPTIQPVQPTVQPQPVYQGQTAPARRIRVACNG